MSADQPRDLPAPPESLAFQPTPTAGACSTASLDSQPSATVLSPNPGPPKSDQVVQSLLPVFQIGQYQILNEIARGGMGVIYQALDQRLDRKVALKVIKAGDGADDEQIRRFQIEAKAAAQLDHPGIVPVYEVGEFGRQPFLAMALIDGQTLLHWMNQSQADPRETARLMLQVAEAVQYAHDRGIVHRDLKPHNILVTREGQAKVTDFGLAKRQDSDPSLTRTGQILGTPSYMPPEQAQGDSESTGPLADVYALGATLYHLLTGRPPFQGATPLETMRQVIEQEPISPRQLNPSIPGELSTICLKCLEKAPGQRYASARAVAQDLDRFIRGQAIAARPAGRWKRLWRHASKRPVAAVLVGAVLLETVAAAIWLWYPKDTARPLLQQPASPVSPSTANVSAKEADASPSPAKSDRPPPRNMIADSAARPLFDGRSLTGWRPMTGNMAVESVPEIGSVISLHDATVDCVLVERADQALKNFRLSLTVYSHESQSFAVQFAQTRGPDVPSSYYKLILDKDLSYLEYKYADGRRSNWLKQFSQFSWQTSAPHVIVIERQQDWWFVAVDDQEPVAFPNGDAEPLRLITLQAHGPGPARISQIDIVNLSPPQ